MLHWNSNDTCMIAEKDGVSYVIRSKLDCAGYIVDAISWVSGVEYLGEFGTIREAQAIAEMHSTRSMPTPGPVIRPWLV